MWSYVSPRLLVALSLSVPLMACREVAAERACAEIEAEVLPAASSAVFAKHPSWLRKSSG